MTVLGTSDNVIFCKVLTALDAREKNKDAFGNQVSFNAQYTLLSVKSWQWYTANALSPPAPLLPW